MKRIIVWSSVSLVVLVGGGVWAGGPSPAALHPIAVLTQATPSPDAPGHWSASWAIAFPTGSRVADPVAHAEDRHVWVTQGTMRVVSDDLPAPHTTIVPVGERVTITAGAMHQWMNVGPDAGALVAHGVVTEVKLHDACGAP